MKSTTLFFFCLLLVLIVFLTIEYFVHKHTLRHFKIRIHVNGTRGKSSITRLIRAGLSEAGISTFAKTTGTMARMIYPDGSEHAIQRWGKPSILEQIGILKTAKIEKASAIVIECMALEPRYQWASEGQILKSHIGVISNVRADHLEVMGPTLRDVTLALSSAIPVSGKLFSNPVVHEDILKTACDERKTKLEILTETNRFQITDAEMDNFSYWEHRENVNLALAVCNELGVDRETALSGMWKANPDPGALLPTTIHFFGKDIIYLNAMAANDSESTRKIWDEYSLRHKKERTAYILFNCREDRMDRSALMAEEIAQWDGIEAIFLIGSGTKYALHTLKKRCKEGAHIFNWESAELDHIFESLVEQVKEKSYIIGLGNIAGIGLEMNQYLKNRASSSL
ncbi:poly-gamma-glutamate synthase PgsB [Leptospira ognonensis]|uniref:Poly-gamma-glutamate synthase PgsB n=1 Tax=Leptospira ognonensis TaxID=2484945 RepID=A0A4V3JR90_9LEPT|nr:poly-gamma-glutamate synthase PgsB [Leptospira ognonensis]TGL59105.1 poly-gamma-glutamate synthase PgsB [Leptospira ognonensis]